MTPRMDGCDGKGKRCDMGLYVVEICQVFYAFGCFRVGFGVEEEGFFKTGPEFPSFGQFVDEESCGDGGGGVGWEVGRGIYFAIVDVSRAEWFVVRGRILGCLV